MATQPLPAVDAHEVHRQAMKISDEDALKLYARIRLDPEAFAELNRYRASLRVRGFRAKLGVSWMFDGMEYPQDTAERSGPLRPGEEVWVPLIVAKYGVKNTAVWEYETALDGSVINKQDFNGPQIPIIQILEIRNPGDFGQQMRQAAAPQLAPCSLCAEEFLPADLAGHILSAHADDIAAAKNKQAPIGDAKKRVEQWAAKQASKHVAGQGEPAPE